MEEYSGVEDHINPGSTTKITTTKPVDNTGMQPGFQDPKGQECYTR